MKHTKRRVVLISIVGVILVLVFVYILLLLNARIYESNRLPDNLRKQFRCDRITADWLPTDKYCDNYKLYERDHAAGKI